MWRGGLATQSANEWCPGAESNHRHADFQSAALPLSYPGRPAGKAGSNQGRHACLSRFQSSPDKSSSGRPLSRFSSSSAGAPGIAYPPFSHWPRSTSAQRFEQNGLYSGEIGFLRHWAHLGVLFSGEMGLLMSGILLVCFCRWTKWSAGHRKSRQGVPAGQGR